MKRIDFLQDSRFQGITPFPKKQWLSSPTMHGEEQRWVDEAIRTNWVSTVGNNIDEIEKQMADYVGAKHAVALSSGTSALHLATRLAAERLYGKTLPNKGTLQGKKVFCTDMTFDASVNPVAYEDGEAVFIDTEKDSWNMSPEALKKAFEIFPEVKLIVVAHLYGTPAKMKELWEICKEHDALIVEDAAESLGAMYYCDTQKGDGGKWKETGSLGDYNCISFNGNKIITGSSGGMFFTNEKTDAEIIRKWSTQSREPAPWYQHKEIGYNYRMSNIVAGVVRGQIPYIEEHINQKKKIWERYKEGFKNLPVTMNPYEASTTSPNFWLSCLLIDANAMAPHKRDELDEYWKHVPGKSSPGEILNALRAFNAEGRPLWKPMHMQPLYRENKFVTIDGIVGQQDNLHKENCSADVGGDIFRRGLCLPSDNKMTPDQQDVVIEIVKRCFL